MTLVTTRRSLSHSLRRAFSFAAFCTAHPLHHIIEFGFPTSEDGEGVRITAASVAASLTRQQNFVLTEFIRELVYF
jgi:hypothetical protein